jgi:hypothetical protein
VDVDTAEIPGAPDQVDLTVSVVEKPTGNLTVAAGYSQADKLSLTASIRKENVFGTGNFLELNVATAHTNRNLSLSTTDPYFTDDGISRTYDVYYRTSRPLNSIGDHLRRLDAGCGGALRPAVLRVRHHLRGPGRGADAHRHVVRRPEQLRDLRRQVRLLCELVPDHRGLGHATSATPASPRPAAATCA